MLRATSVTAIPSRSPSAAARRITTAPVVSLSAPPSSSSDTTPTFSGTAGTLAGDSSTVTVRVHAGSSVAGALVQSLTATRSSGGSYSVSATALSAGHVHRAYRAGRCAGNVGYSPSRTFTITGAAADTTAPVVSLSAPPASSTNTTPTFSGTAGTLAGDSSSVTVRVHAGSSVSGAAVQSLSATRSSGGSYSVGARRRSRRDLHGARRPVAMRPATSATARRARSRSQRHRRGTRRLRWCR